MAAEIAVGFAPMPRLDPSRVAVVVPCHNEELTVGKVVAEFRAALPGALVLVVDNASRDRTSEVAREAGPR